MIIFIIVILFKRFPVAHLVACLIRDVEVADSIPGFGKPAFRRFHLLVHVRKVASGFGKRKLVSISERKPGNI